MPMNPSAAVALAAALGLAASALPAAAAPGAAHTPMLLAQTTASADRANKIAAADVEIRVATDELAQARRRFEAGRQITEKDRVNQLQGGGPMTDAYNLRVQALQQDVTKAQARLDRAITARKALDN